MKELLYKKSEAVAALNRVDGFHPMELARKIGEEGQEEQLYLQKKKKVSGIWDLMYYKDMV